MSKRLVTSAVVGAMLVLGTVLVVSLIGGDDKPEVATEKPAADDPTAQEDLNEADHADDAVDNVVVANDPDDGQDDGAVDDDQCEGKKGGKGQQMQNGHNYRNIEANAGMNQMNSERNALWHEQPSGSAERCCADSEHGDADASEEERGDGGEDSGKVRAGKA